MLMYDLAPNWASKFCSGVKCRLKVSAGPRRTHIRRLVACNFKRYTLLEGLITKGLITRWIFVLYQEERAFYEGSVALLFKAQKCEDFYAISPAEKTWFFLGSRRFAAGHPPGGL